MDQGEVQNYLMKFEKEIKDKEVLNQSEKQNQLNSNYPKEQERRIFEQCSKCKINLNQKLFQIKKCNHKICNNCLQGIDINFNLSYNCLIRDCNQKFTKQEYKNYIQYLQDLSKLEVIQTNVNISQQNQNHQQFECDNCFKIQKEDIKYVLNCGHIICLTCAIKNSLLRRCCIQASQVEEYQNFRKTIQLKCEGCKNSFLLPNLFELRCGHKFCLICCQKIYSGKIQRCLVESCQNSVYLIENLNKFIIDQVIQESKEIQLKKEENIIQNLNEEPTIDKQRKQIVQKEEAKVIEQTNLNQRNQDQDNKNEEEKSISAQNSVITIKEIKQFEQVNSKKEEILLQPKEQKQIIVSNRSKVLNPFDSFLNMEKQAHSFKEMDSEEEFFISQQLQEIIQAQEKESEFYRGNCTKCNQEFSIFNRKQQINCKLHEIGVCCILIKFNDCPQCEEGLQKQTKKTLIIKKTPLEEEYFFESTIKSSYYNDKPQSYQQTYQGQNKIFLNMEKHIPNQGQEIRRNTTIDSAYKRVLENRQLVDDRTLIRNEIRNHNELTLQRSPPPFQLSHNTNHYNYGKFNLGKIYGQPYREGPLNIRFNSRYPVR
ncbi:unnamed protein product [Paramecium sonneborni]|uniref:RING-type domain-containing protein n=1 Tax=Paramecium sonneborni TaxID=65129 RepID=A0A8S1RK32_9CILI|nr:unnamed protein product [Paramecium sonneborni]